MKRNKTAPSSTKTFNNNNNNSKKTLKSELIVFDDYYNYKIKHTNLCFIISLLRIISILYSISLFLDICCWILLLVESSTASNSGYGIDIIIMALVLLLATIPLSMCFFSNNQTIQCFYWCITIHGLGLLVHVCVILYLSLLLSSNNILLLDDADRSGNDFDELLLYAGSTEVFLVILDLMSVYFYVFHIWKHIRKSTKTLKKMEFDRNFLIQLSSYIRIHPKRIHKTTSECECGDFVLICNHRSIQKIHLKYDDNDSPE